MKHNNEWYGEKIRRVEQNRDYILIQHECNGSGILMDYPVFPAVNLVFMDFDCTDTFAEPNPHRNIVDVRHYQQGRVEFEMRNDKVFHMQEGEFCINTLSKLPVSYSFPFGQCSGMSILIDLDSIDARTKQQCSFYGVDILNIHQSLEQKQSSDVWFIGKTPQHLRHVFDELYTAKGKEPIEYFRIKILELLYHAQKLHSTDLYEATYYKKEHIKIVKRIWTVLTKNLENRTSLDSLLDHEPISSVTFQAIFKQIYGDTAYASLKKYKMNYAASRLRESVETISKIANSVGYINTSKFSKAFQDIYGVLPKDYRRQNKII